MHARPNLPCPALPCPHTGQAKDASSCSYSYSYTTAIDPRTGRTFWINWATGETCWVQPGSLPPGWEAEIEPDGHDLFYVHAATGRRQWEPPEAELRF